MASAAPDRDIAATPSDATSPTSNTTPAFALPSASSASTAVRDDATWRSNEASEGRDEEEARDEEENDHNGIDNGNGIGNGHTPLPSLPFMARSSRRDDGEAGYASKNNIKTRVEDSEGTYARRVTRSRSSSASNASSGGRFVDDGEKEGNGSRREDEDASYEGANEVSTQQHATSQSSQQQDTRIVFRGREIFADDLVGLRVAKTFVGHGRFLGQVVKFDEPTALYTIVYADGDAEELSIENTIQILIQDEIERADPAVPPLAVSFQKDRPDLVPDSPNEGSFAPPNAGAVAPTAPSIAAAASASASMPGYYGAGAGANTSVGASSSATTGAISDREAKFVIGLFENYALPILMRQGWRVQSDASGGQRYVAPNGNFNGAGRVYASPLEVVELIASDNELLTICFPQNVHSAILSLFPDPAVPRKRVPSITMETGPFDLKRMRVDGHAHGGREAFGATSSRAIPTATVDRAFPGASRTSSMESESYMARVPPFASDRFVPGFASRASAATEATTVQRDDPDYRRAPLSGGRRSPAFRSQEISHPARWAPSQQPAANSEVAASAGYLRDSRNWREREMPSTVDAVAPGYRALSHRAEEQPPRYYNDRTEMAISATRPLQDDVVGTTTPPLSRQYRDMHISSSEFRPSRESFPHQYVSAPTEQVREYRTLSSADSVAASIPRRGTGLGARGFSMSDVDRNSRNYSLSAYDRGQQRRSPLHRNSLPSYSRTASGSSEFSLNHRGSSSRATEDRGQAM